MSDSRCRFLRLAMASIMDILKIKPFVEVSVGQLLWGYEDPLLKLAKDVVPKEQKLPYEEFGVMYGKNSTSPVIITSLFEFPGPRPSTSACLPKNFSTCAPFVCFANAYPN